MAHRVHHPEVAAPEGSVVPAAPAPASDWQRAYQSGDLPAAADLLRQLRGSFESAVDNGSSAKELYEIYDLATKGKEPGPADHALRRIANDFPKDPYAQISAHQLCDKLPAAEGKKYCEQAKNSPLEDPDCVALRAAPNKDEAAKLAQEYVNSHGDGGTCRDEAQRIISGAADDSGDAGAPKVDGKPKPGPKP